MELSWDNVLLAFALTLFAGLSTGIGSAIAFLTKKKTNKKFLSLSRIQRRSDDLCLIRGNIPPRPKRLCEKTTPRK